MMENFYDAHPINWTPEYNLLLDCCRHEPLDAEPLRCANEATGINWQTLTTLATKEGIAQIAYKKLRQSGLHALLPAAEKAELQKHYYGTAAANAVIFEDLAALLQLLNSQDINVIVLKGAVLASLVYNDRALRPMEDVDLLVKKEDMAAIDSTLTAAGYYTPHSIDFNNLPDSYLTSVNYIAPTVSHTNFHIHWHLVNSTIPNSWSIQQIDIKHIWEESKKIKIAGKPAFIMAPHHQLIHLAEHALRVTHSLDKISYLADIHSTTVVFQKEIDWQKLIAANRNFNLDRFIAIPLKLAAELLDTPIPTRVLNQLLPEKSTTMERIFYRCASANIRVAGLSYLVHLSNNRGLKRKALFLLQTIFPPKQALAIRFEMLPKEITPVFYCKRTIESIGAVSTILIKAVRKRFSFG